MMFMLLRLIGSVNGNKAHEKCCNIYDVDKVNDSILRAMGLIK